MNAARQTDATYAAVVELERAGVTRQAAFAAVADREGITAGAAAQRYYKARSSSAQPFGKRRRNAAAATAQLAAPVAGETDIGTLLETCALLVLEAVRQVRDLELDAARWREVSAIANR